MITIDRALSDPNLLGAALGDSATWSTWLVVLRAAFGLPLNTEARVVFAKVAGGREPPQRPVQELWAVAGRRSGKSRTAAAIAVHAAAFVDYRDKLAPGEEGLVLTLSPTVRQSGLVFSYCKAFLEQSPILQQRIEGVTAGEIRLTGNITIATHPSSFRSVRGPTLLAAILDETAFFRDADSNAANPDLEVYRALIPGLIANGMIIGISSPYRRVGLLHQKYRDHFGQNDPEVLVVQGGTEVFNPTISKIRIEQARRSDPQAARSEWDAEFRGDLSQFLDDATIDAAIEYNRPLEIPPAEGVQYYAFTDASAGRHDQFCLCLSHKDGDRFIADLVRGRRPPFNAEEVAGEYATLAQDYRCSTIVGDNFSGEWVAQAFRKAGIEYRKAKLPRSQLCLEALPFFMRGVVSIPNHPMLVRELRLLERRVHRSGKDTVDHGQGGSDDYANVLVGALHLAMAEARRPPTLARIAPIVIRLDQDHSRNLNHEFRADSLATLNFRAGR